MSLIEHSLIDRGSRWVLKSNQSSVRRCEAAGVEVERPQVILEVDVEPFATRGARLRDCHRHQLGAYALPSGFVSHDRVKDECVQRAVPGDVDETKPFTSIPCADPA